jgi:hypothetical protein
MRSNINFGVVALACAIIACSSGLLLAGDPTAWQLKTPAPNVEKFRPFLDAVSSLKADLEKTNQLPSDASARFTKAKNLSGAFQQAVQELTAALRQNGEIEAFDALIVARLQKAGRSSLLPEIKQAGGPFNIVVNSKRFVDAEIGDLSTRIRASAVNPGMLETIANITLGSVLQLIETKPAYAVYGGGITCRCRAAKLIYYMALGIHASYCCL